MPLTSAAQTWTIGRLLTWTAGYLKEHGSESPRLDAELLLAEARGCQRIDLYTSYADIADDQLRTRFRELVNRRAGGEPVAYLLGRREFYSLDFQVSPAVLIPRPETEFLVIALLDLVKQQSSREDPLHIVDVGTGSGVLAVCLARELPHSQVTAVDISPEALAVARQNAGEHGVADRVAFLKGDLLAGLPAEAEFDFIVTNPPYIATSEIDSLARDVIDHEPRAALIAGPTGTEVIERLVPQAAERLRPGGWLLLEISPQILPAVEQLLAADDHFSEIGTMKDLARLPRVVMARRTP